MIESLKAEFAALASTKLAWFLAGVFLSGQNVASVVESLKTFVGL